VTEYGLKCFAAGELTSHDPDDYIKRLSERCPAMDPTTLVYIEESQDF
jgi:hypothetical protein